MLDVLIVGGGPAGLNAALWLGRCRRSVLVLDSGRPRNARSPRVSGFPTRDGTDPWEVRRLSRKELGTYPTVEIRDGEVETAAPVEGGFEILADGERIRGRKLILAPGLLGDCPDLPDAEEFYGRGVYPCPYCDGFEHRDEPLVAFGRGEDARGIAVELTVWSRDVTLVTHGPGDVPDRHRADLDRRGIRVVETAVEGLEGGEDGMEAIRFVDGSRVATRAMFFAFDTCRQSPLVDQLGCEIGETGAVETRHCERTNVPGLFVAGDASRRVKFAVVAAAEGAMAAFAANSELLQEDLRRSGSQDR